LSSPYCGPPPEGRNARAAVAAKGDVPKTPYQARAVKNVFFFNQSDAMPEINETPSSETTADNCQAEELVRQPRNFFSPMRNLNDGFKSSSRENALLRRESRPLCGSDESARRQGVAPFTGVG
jgi:hypothetical protein